MINILLLEDEPYTRKFFKQLLISNPLTKNVYDTSNCKEAIKLAKDYKPEIAMLDIELGANEAMNGLEVAKVISNLLPGTFFVFVTGYTKYAVDSFAVHPFDYIIKPVNKDRISEVITKIAKRLNNSTISKKANMLTLKNKDETYFVHPRDIIFFERQSRDTLVHTKHGVFTINENLTDLETNLFDNFLRVHQSFLINLNKVKMIKNLTNRSYEIEFVGYNKKAFLSRYKYDEFKEKFAPLL